MGGGRRAGLPAASSLTVSFKKGGGKAGGGTASRSLVPVYRLPPSVRERGND